MKRFLPGFVGVLWGAMLVLGCSAPAPSQPRQEEDPSLLEAAATLTPQSGEGSELKTAFNDASDTVRLMLLLSPT